MSALLVDAATDGREMGPTLSTGWIDMLFRLEGTREHIE